MLPNRNDIAIKGDRQKNNATIKPLLALGGRIDPTRQCTGNACDHE